MTLFEKLESEAPQSVRELLEGLKGLRENPEYHPESSTYEHINIVVSRLENTGDADLIMTGFLHDLLKLKMAVVNKKTGFHSSPLHDKAVAEFIYNEKEVQNFIEKFGANAEYVTYMCEQHMRVKRLGEMRSSKRWVIMSHELFPKLCLFTLADGMRKDWAVCYEKWKVDSELKWFMPMGDVTFGWLRDENLRMLGHRISVQDKPQKISGFDLLKIGYPKGEIIGVAIKATKNECSHLSWQEIYDKFVSICISPMDFFGDEVFGEIAETLYSTTQRAIQMEVE